MLADPLQTVRRERLGDVVAKQLESAIRAGQYPPGGRLPGQRQLAQELGISRPILREALQTLELRGLITTQHGSGTYVAEPPGAATAPAAWLRENHAHLRQFYEFRQIIEPEAAALAACRATPEEIAQLQRNVTESAAAVAAGETYAFVMLDIEFHALISRMSGNPYLFHALDQIISVEGDARQAIHRLPGHLPLAQRRHEAICDGIVARAAGRARAAMLEALTGVLDDIEEAFVARPRREKS
jgi:GntR family transcriptional repressor for pyruvate dehydrogenase complex